MLLLPVVGLCNLTQTGQWGCQIAQLFVPWECVWPAAKLAPAFEVFGGLVAANILSLVLPLRAWLWARSGFVVVTILKCLTLLWLIITSACVV